MQKLNITTNDTFLMQKLNITTNDSDLFGSTVSEFLEYYSNRDYLYPFFPNGEEYNISEGISSHNSSDKGSKKSFNDFSVHFIKVTAVTSLVISVFGALGNGIVIWLLGFRIKRNPFSTFILNLAIADLGVLLSVVLCTMGSYIYISGIVITVYIFLFTLMYTASQSLLTAISIDRCVAVFFPLWHQCRRPPRLSTIVCALVWVLSVSLTSVTCTLENVYRNVTRIEESYQFMVNAVLCLPVMTIATVSLFIKVCLKARQHGRGKLLTIVLLTLLFFLLFAFPLNIMWILADLRYIPVYMPFGAILLAVLNSSVNPAIYFMVGSQWKSRRREGMKMILQKVFKEEEGRTEETPVENQL